MAICVPVCPPMLPTCRCPHTFLYCVRFRVSAFIEAEQRGVSLGVEAAACSRGPARGSPYPAQLGFVIGSLRADGHAASSNPSK